MAFRSLVLMVALILYVSHSPGQEAMLRATDAEVSLIREALGIDRWTPEERERVLSFDGWRFGPEELIGFVRFKPVLVQESACVAWEAVLGGRFRGDEYEWSSQNRYHHWLGQSESDCVIESSEQLPETVLTRERTPTDVMMQILEAEEELLQLTLSQADVEVLGNLAAEWKLEEVSLNNSLDPELGFFYHATLGARGRSRGPTCSFTIREGKIRIARRSSSTRTSSPPSKRSRISARASTSLSRGGRLWLR